MPSIVGLLEVRRDVGRALYAVGIVYLRTTSSARSTATDGTVDASYAACSGPCNNHESLYTIEQFKQLNLFHGVANAAGLQEAWKRYKAINGHWDEVLASCKTAAGTLRRASVLPKAAKAKPKPKPKKKAGETGATPTGQDSAFQVFDDLPRFEGMPGIEADVSMCDDHDFSLPFIFCDEDGEPLPGLFFESLRGDRKNIHQQNPSEADKMLLKLHDELVKFTETFNKSDKLTSGKGSLMCSEGVEALVRTSATKNTQTIHV